MLRKISSYTAFVNFKLDEILLAGVYGLLLLFMALYPRVNHDVTLYLYMGREVLDGKVPYVDFIELNPPLIIYLNTIPALVEKITPLSVVPAALLLGWLLTVWSTLHSRHLLSMHFKHTNPQLATAIPLTVALYSFYLFAKADFGQREHLFVLLFFPGFFARWLRYEGHNLGRWQAILLGITAAIGVLLKPYFILIAVLPELYWLVEKRNLSNLKKPEVVAFGVIAAAYALHFLLIPAAMREAFFSGIVPLMLKGYDVYNAPLADLIRQPTTILVATLGLAGLMPWHKPADSALSLLRALSIVTLAALSTYLWQHKGWLYHFIPVYASTLVLLSTATLSADSLAWNASQRHIFRAVCAAFILICMREVPLTRFEVWEVEQFVEAHSGPEDAVLVIDTSVEATFPMLLRTGRASGSRYYWSPQIAMIYKDVPLEPDGTPRYRALADSPDNQRYLAELTQDVLERKPKLIFIRRDRCNACPPSFSILDYLTEMGFIDRAMSDYRRLKDLYQGGPVSAVFQFEEPLPETHGETLMFGDDFSLLAWRLDGGAVDACQTVTLSTWWQKRQPADVNYSLTLAVVGSMGGMGNNDSAPANWNTSEWPIEQTLSDRRSLKIPCDLSAGEYQLITGLYDPQTGAILPVADAQGNSLGDFLVLTTFKVD